MYIVKGKNEAAKAVLFRDASFYRCSKVSSLEIRHLLATGDSSVSRLRKNLTTFPRSEGSAM